MATVGRVEIFRLLMVALIIVGVVAQVLVDKSEAGWGLYASVGLMAVTALLVWWLGELRTKSVREAAIAARGETLMDVGNILEPLARELGRVATLPTKERRAECGNLRKAVLNSAANLNPASLRANYFQLNDDATALLPVADTGRAIGPKDGFYKGIKSGDAALMMVANDEYRFVDDTDLRPPPGWVPSNNREYRTFISVTVGTPGRPSGMLTLDAPNPGELAEEDLRMMLVLGRILGTAEVLTR